MSVLFDRARLESLFKPRSIVLIGATERSLWSNAAYGNLDRFGFAGPLHLINRKGGTVYGRPAITSVAQIEGVVDLALLMAPAATLEATLDELAGKAKSAVILSSGFAETGPEGRARQNALASRAREAGVTLLGPNCLGFINYVDKIPIWTVFRRRQRDVGSLAIVSQSGAIANSIAEFGYRQSVPMSYLVSTGNEADVDIASVLHYLADDESTRAIALFMESARDAEAFASAAEYLQNKGKPLVVLKVGSSEISARAAQAHTGSLVGDDHVFDAVCRRYGAIRVSSIEDLVFTADLLSRMPPIKGSGVGFLAMSGGMCEIAADRFEDVGVRLPEFSAETTAALRDVLSDYGTPHNPLDVTGAAMLDLSTFTKALSVAGKDSAIDVFACLIDAPETEQDHPLMGQAMEAIGAGLVASGKPGIVFSNLANNTTPVGRAAEKTAGLIYSSAGLDRGVVALTNAISWWDRRRTAAPRKKTNETVHSPAIRPVSERDVLDFLARHGAPTISSRIVRSATEADAAARDIDAPVVLKIASAQIGHKTEVGGVALNIAPERAGAEFDAMMDRVRRAAPDAVLDGIALSPMRERGVELFVGVLRDPHWGPVISVGFGGVLVELLKDTALRLLPVSADDVVEMLSGLRGKALLAGFRGAPPIDVRAVAQAVAAIGDAALALGPKLVSLEVNPLWARGGHVEALDGLAIWKEEG